MMDCSTAWFSVNSSWLMEGLDANGESDSPPANIATSTPTAHASIASGPFKLAWIRVDVIVSGGLYAIWLEAY